MKYIRILVLICLFAGCSTSARRQETDIPVPLTIYNSQVRAFHSKSTNVEYKLYVSLPRDYSKSDKTYPVIFVLDADYFFPVVQNFVNLRVDHDEMPPAIIVGIAYPGVAEEKHGPVFKLNRTRDYTPTHMTNGGYGREYQRASGGADHFFDFIENELAPFVESEFHGSATDRTIVGISYGGLAASYALVNRPGLFQRYLIISPSLWWDKRFMFRFEREKINSLQDLPAKVFIATGELEKGEGKVADMGKDISDFFSEINSRHFPNFFGKVWVVPNETHHTVFPAASARGITYLFE
jgi:predicted alpha/beta superfamily hydrolase